MEMIMAVETSTVRFRRPYQNYRTGKTYDLPKGFVRSLEIMGLVDRVTEPQLELAIAPEPEVERAVMPAAKRPRRRKK